MSEKLKPCGCGGKLIFRSCQVAEDAMAVWVKCLGCEAEGGPVEDAYADYPTAIILWNNRKTH